MQAMGINALSSMESSEHQTSIIDEHRVNLLVILPDKYGTCFHKEKNIFDLYGWNVTITGLTEYVNPCDGSKSYGSPVYPVDYLLSEIDDISNFDGIYIPAPTYPFLFADSI